MALAGTQNLPSVRDRLAKIIEDEMPAFISHARRRRPPILDTSQDGLSKSAAVENNLPDRVHIFGLQKFQNDMVRELKRVEKFISQPDYDVLPVLSTNAPYLLAVWDEVTASQNVIAVCKTFPAPPGFEFITVKPNNGVQSIASTVKVDVVSDYGRKWTRINTVTMDRYLRELYELDGSDLDYDSTSEGSADETVHPSPGGWSLAPPVDNSLISMGKLLVEAARHNRVPGSHDVPQVHVRLTRVRCKPNSASRHTPSTDHAAEEHLADDRRRIDIQVGRLSSLGIHVSIGERGSVGPSHEPKVINKLSLVPTRHLNLDLSILIAFCSDISHALPPLNELEAIARFKPLARKAQSQLEVDESIEAGGKDADGAAVDDVSDHSRSLVNQSMQEARKGLIEDVRSRLVSAPASSLSRLQRERTRRSSASTSADEAPFQFWTTPGAKARCLAIMTKIGGPRERIRAESLFSAGGGGLFWKESRYDTNYLPGFPVRLFPSDIPVEYGRQGVGPKPDAETLGDEAQARMSKLTRDVDRKSFWVRLQQTCLNMLRSVATPDPASAELNDTGSKLSVTTHTAQSLLWGSYAGMTTLTANKASVKSVLREMESMYGVGGWEGWEQIGGASTVEGGQSVDSVEKAIAAIWVVEPRSLAEGMRADGS